MCESIINSPLDTLLDSLVARYRHNVYVIIGFGESGAYGLKSARVALDIAIQTLESKQRVQKLVLFNPAISLIKTLKTNRDILTCDIDIYMDGTMDISAIEDFREYGVVRYYKNMRFVE